MIDIEQIEKAILLYINTDDEIKDQLSLDEMNELAFTAGAEIICEFSQKRNKPDPAHYIGIGKVDELRIEIQESSADMVIVNDDLSPLQQRNLENSLEIRVIDRTQLILDIFAQRARSLEGKLQVELAQMNYMLPRLAGSRKALSRLGGGIGTRGPGETKLETDRRRIRDRISDLNDELEVIRKHRKIQNQARKQLPYPSAALVGYTSAGKSTLLNLLSGSEVLVDKKLFATLDPTTRRVDFPDGWSILLTDTVGFIRDLPHNLIAAFRATLEEVTDSDFLIHVVDASHPDMESQISAVNEVLIELNADDKPIIMVFNKCDKIDDQYKLRNLVADTPNSVYISALLNDGIHQLISVIQNTIKSLFVNLTYQIPYERNDLVSVFYANGKVNKIDYYNDFIEINADLSLTIADKFKDYIVKK